MSMLKLDKNTRFRGQAMETVMITLILVIILILLVIFYNKKK